MCGSGIVLLSLQQRRQRVGDSAHSGAKIAYIICVRLLWLQVLSESSLSSTHDTFVPFFYLLSVCYYGSLADDFTRTPTSWLVPLVCGFNTALTNFK